MNSLAHSYTDAAGNTTFSEPCSVAHYTVMFMGSGVIAKVQEHQTMPVLRGDYWLTTDGGLRLNGTVTDDNN